MSQPQVGGKSKDAQPESATAPPSVTVSKPAGSPATSSSRLPASSSSRATVQGSALVSEVIGAVPVTEERNPKKPILLLLVGAAVIAFMVVLIIGTVILARKDTKQLSAKISVAATRRSLSAKTPLATAPVRNVVNGSSAQSTVSMEMANPTCNASEAIGCVRSDEAVGNSNSSSAPEHSLVSEAGTLNTTSEIHDHEYSMLETETAVAASEPVNASGVAAGGDGGRSHVSSDEATNASGDEGMFAMKFSDSPVVSLSSTMDATVVPLDVSDSAQALSTEEVEIATSGTPGVAMSSDQ
ncbi:uncharacterized protein [Dermacentor andersoni]|uniref:uncharacterized protein n=1 Tax=Dermacentor andersoni TaxID=34620 RepID=UPI00241688BC|nr:uncharacterized protein LOC129384480 [Dermacentor andersoni]